jgi:5'-methylthioadenosine phosphorylase
VHPRADAAILDAVAASGRAPVGVIGGSGLYSLLDDAEEVVVETPYGPPSDPLVVADAGDRQVIFVPRHGRDHRFPAHRVPYRANLWALRSLGVQQVLAPCAVGALDRGLAPGYLVVPDQVIDRTSGRTSTFYDTGAVHVPFADPYCPRGRASVLAGSARAGWPAIDGGTMVVVEGPRFSSRAESQWFAAAGGTLVNMTGMPEAALARELALCYTAVALVTDLDAGISTGSSVTQAEVFAVFGSSIDRLRGVLLDVAASLSDDRDCPCPNALDGTAASL